MFRFAWLILIAILSGCGSSSDSGISISGVAASGAAVSGTVRLRDANGIERVKTTTTGRFRFDVQGLTAPFVLKAEWTDGNGAHTLYSLAEAPGTFNLNPLTTLAVADAAGLADPATLFDSLDPATLALASSHLAASIAALRERLAPLLASYAGADVDPLTSSFSADHTGLDQFFDEVTVTITSGIATIASTLNGAVLFQASTTSLGSGVICLNWSAAEALIAYDPRTAVDGSGNAFVVWTQDDGSHWNVHARRFSPSLGWAAAVMISDGAGDAAFPVIAVDGSGNAMSSWYQWNGSKSRIQSARFTVAGGWDPQVSIDNDGGEANYPAIAVSASGDAAAAWHQFVGSRTDVWVARYTAGVGWGAAEVLSDQTDSAFRPQVAADPTGTATVVWTKAVGMNQTLWASQAPAAGAFSTPEQISTAGHDVYGQTAIACDADGNVLALWGQTVSMVGYVMTAALNRPGSGWESAVTVGDSGGDSYFPSIAMNASGDALAVWKQSDGTQYNIWAAQFSLTGGWLAPSMVSDLSGDGGYPHAAVDAIGNCMAAWSQMESTTYSIRTNRSLSGSGWGASNVLYQSDIPTGVFSIDAFPSDMSMNGSGMSLVVWGTTS